MSTELPMPIKGPEERGVSIGLEQDRIETRIDVLFGFVMGAERHHSDRRRS